MFSKPLLGDKPCRPFNIIFKNFTSLQDSEVFLTTPQPIVQWREINFRQGLWTPTGELILSDI